MAKGGPREGCGRPGFEDRQNLRTSLDGRHMAALDEYVARHSLRSRSEAVRRLIDRAAAADKGAARRRERATSRAAK